MIDEASRTIMKTRGMSASSKEGARGAFCSVDSIGVASIKVCLPVAEHQGELTLSLRLLMHLQIASTIQVKRIVIGGRRLYVR
jgi:hypothetical protein